jgi:RNA polymerase sigma factor (sigma-70 family)
LTVSRGNPPDKKLIAACAKGDEAAWRTLIFRYRRLIYSTPGAYRIPPADADEIFQRVSVKLFENLGRLRRVEGLASWLVTTTRRECQAYLRGVRKWRSLDEGDPIPEVAVDPPDVAGRLHDIETAHALALAMDRLGEPCRPLLTALYVEEPPASYQELSRRLGRPIGSLGPTKMRCLKKLRKLYVDEGGLNP